MIHKNAQVGDVKDIVVAEFGNGTLSVVNSSNPDGSKSILLKTIPKQEIGDLIFPSAKDTDSNDYIPELILRFNNYKGFEVLMQYMFNVMDSYHAETGLQVGMEQRLKFMMTHAIGILKQKAKTLGKDGFLEIRKKQFQFGVGIFSSTTLVPVVVAIGEEMLMDIRCLDLYLH